MRATDNPDVEWRDLGAYRVCIEGGRFSVHGKPERRGGSVRPSVIARGVIAPDGCVTYESAPLDVVLERELIWCWRAIRGGET